MRYILAVLAFTLFAASARADCANEAKVRSDVAAWKSGAVVVRLDAQQTMFFLSAFNALPPSSLLTADTILVVTKPGALRVVLALFRGECVSQTIFIQTAVFNQIMGDS